MIERVERKGIKREIEREREKERERESERERNKFTVGERESEYEEGERALLLVLSYINI